MTNTRLKRILELIERRRRAAVICQQRGLLAVRAGHTLKAAALYHPRACMLRCACETHLIRHAKASPFAVGVWRRRPRSSACRSSAGDCAWQHPERKAEASQGCRKHSARCRECNLLERRKEATFATRLPRTRRGAMSLVRLRTMLGAPARVSDIKASR